MDKEKLSELVSESVKTEIKKQTSMTELTEASAVGAAAKGIGAVVATLGLLTGGQIAVNSLLLGGLGVIGGGAGLAAAGFFVPTLLGFGAYQLSRKVSDALDSREFNSTIEKLEKNVEARDREIAMIKRAANNPADEEMLASQSKTLKKLTMEQMKLGRRLLKILNEFLPHVSGAFTRKEMSQLEGMATAAIEGRLSNLKDANK